MNEPDLQGLKELAENTRFPEIRKLCYGLIERFKEFQDDREGIWDFRVFREKMVNLRGLQGLRRVLNEYIFTML